MLTFQSRDQGGGFSGCSPATQGFRLPSGAQETSAAPYPLGPLAEKWPCSLLPLKVTVKIIGLSSSITVRPSHQASDIVSNIIVMTALIEPSGCFTIWAISGLRTWRSLSLCHRRLPSSHRHPAPLSKLALPAALWAAPHDCPVASQASPRYSHASKSAIPPPSRSPANGIDAFSKRR